MIGQIVGGLAGGLLNYQNAKSDRKAMREANELSNMGYLDSRPYLTFGYSGGKGALQDVINTGAYTGNTYAGLNPMQTGALNNQFGLGQTANLYGGQLAQTGAGFGNNYNTLFNQAMGGGALNNAINYATANRGPLVDAALRDSTRMLTEQTLPGINRAASSTNNTNSSRAGIADALAMRDYNDRAADVSANITDQLVNRSLGQQQRDFSNAMAANQGLSNAFSTGFDTGFRGLGQQLAAGSAFQQDDQNRLNDARDSFERQRDFELDQYARFMSDIMGRAPTSGTRYTPNMTNPTMAALSGAMSGAGIGGKLQNFFSGFGGGSPSPYSYVPAQGYNMYQSPAAGMGGSNPYIF